MSRRTMPLSVSTFGPLVPSPGNGPAVSSGIARRARPVPVGEVVVDDEPAAVDEVVLAALESELLLQPHAAATATTRGAAEELQRLAAVHERREVERQPAVVVFDGVLGWVVQAGSHERSWVGCGLRYLAAPTRELLVRPP